MSRAVAFAILDYMNMEKRNFYEGVDMHVWSSEATAKAEAEIRGIMHSQNPTGRTDGENNFFEMFIGQMRNQELTPADAVLQARRFADSRQDGHGGGVIQDGY